MATRAAYSIQPAPASLKPIGPSFRWRSDLIDYSKHEAYADFVRKPGLATRLQAFATYGRSAALLATKRLLSYEKIPTEYRQAETAGDRVGFVRAAFSNLVRFGRGKAKLPLPDTPLAATLERDGIVVLEMPEQRMDALAEVAQPFFQHLAERRGARASGRAFDESRMTVSRTNASDLYRTLDTIFAEAGLIETVSAYVGRPVRLIDANPQINDASDSFWRDIFEDLGDRPLPATAYCHRDASGGDVKIIVYCSDVAEKNGPFSYAVGSNRMEISRVDDLLCEANDHNGLSVTDVRARKLFAALPAKLRQKGLFGNDLSDESPESRAIVDSLWQVTGKRGSIVAFDTKGIHRGGMVEQAERRVITCVLG